MPEQPTRNKNRMIGLLYRDEAYALISITACMKSPNIHIGTLS